MAQQNALDVTRNIGTIAHIDAGKTTVTEGILYRTGIKHKIGAVHEGEATMDWMSQEQERGITITSAATTCFWQDYRINIIDTPGHIDFTVEVERSLRVLDGAVVIFDGKMGVEPQSETVWRQADKYQVPRICFINKINQTGGDFYSSLETMQERLSKDVYPIHLPIGHEQDINGVVDLIEMKSYTYNEFTDKQLQIGDVPEDMREKCERFRQHLIEGALEHDDELLEQYLETGELSEAEIKQAVRSSVLSGRFFVVSGGDGRGVIVEKLLDAIVDFLPSPVDVPPAEGEDPKTGDTLIRQADPSDPFAALAFKVAADPHVGKLTFFRVYSGTMSAGSYVLNANTGEKERLGRIVRLHANHREDVPTVSAGDIAAGVGLKNTTTGDTLSDKDHPIMLENITFPDPPVSVAIEPKTKADQEKMSQALQRLAEEDPTFQVATHEETGQTIVSGMGKLHLDIIVDRMKREFKVEANVGQPQVAYREAMKQPVQNVEAQFIRQSGGRGQYGHVIIDAEPRERGEGFEFENKIVGGVIPKEFINPIEEGIKEALASGVIAGYPVVDVKVRLHDGSFHEVDSSEVAFKIAGSMAIQDAVKQSNPVLLEPVMKVEVTTPEEFMGDVMGDINARRGQVEQMDDRANSKIIEANVPLAEMFDYETDLRSMTQGRASSSMELSHYGEVPSHVAEQIIGGSGSHG